MCKDKLTDFFVVNACSSIGFMHMSLRCPEVDPQTDQGDMFGNTRGWIEFFAPVLGEIQEMFQDH